MEHNTRYITLYELQDPPPVLTFTLLHLKDSLSKIISQHMQLRAPQAFVLQNLFPRAMSFTLTNLLRMLGPVDLTNLNSFLLPCGGFGEWETVLESDKLRLLLRVDIEGEGLTALDVGALGEGAV